MDNPQHFDTLFNYIFPFFFIVIPLVIAAVAFLPGMIGRISYNNKKMQLKQIGEKITIPIEDMKSVRVGKNSHTHHIIGYYHGDAYVSPDLPTTLLDKVSAMWEQGASLQADLYLNRSTDDWYLDENSVRVIPGSLKRNNVKKIYAEISKWGTEQYEMPIENNDYNKKAVEISLIISGVFMFFVALGAGAFFGFLMAAVLLGIGIFKAASRARVDEVIGRAQYDLMSLNNYVLLPLTVEPVVRGYARKVQLIGEYKGKYYYTPIISEELEQKYYEAKSLGKMTDGLLYVDDLEKPKQWLINLESVKFEFSTEFYNEVEENKKFNDPRLQKLREMAPEVLANEDIVEDNDELKEDELSEEEKLELYASLMDKNGNPPEYIDVPFGRLQIEYDDVEDNSDYEESDYIESENYEEANNFTTPTFGSNSDENVDWERDVPEEIEEELSVETTDYEIKTDDDFFKSFELPEFDPLKDYDPMKW